MNTESRENEIALCVRRVLKKYFHDIDGETASGLHELFMASAEKPLIEEVLHRAGHNQSRAAEWLGINRNTLRKKMQQYGLE